MRLKHLGNIKEIDGASVPAVDVIIGGSPCQDLSVASKGAGLAGERSGLFMDQIRIVKEMRRADEADGRANYLVRPRYMVWENVPGAFSSNKGEDFRAVLEETAKIAELGAVIPRPADGKWRNAGCIMGNGWSIAWRVLDAQFWGVPQRRRRISLIADFGGYSAPEILFERKGMQRDIEESTETGKKSATSPGNGTESTDRGAASVNHQALCAATQQSGAEILTDLCPTITAAAGMSGNNQPYIAYDGENGIAHCLKSKANHSWREDSDTVVVQSAGFNAKAGSKARGIAYRDEVSPTLKSGQNTHVLENAYGFNSQNSATAAGVDFEAEKTPVMRRSVQVVVYDARGNGNGETGPTLTGDHQNRVTDYTAICAATGQANAEIVEELSPTLNCNHEQPIIFRQLSARRLTPLECERLQGYPDRWTTLPKLTDMTDEEYTFFSWVWILNKSMKSGKPMEKIEPPKKAGLIRWYNKLDSDSARYKALGNSIAIPPWKWICKRISAMYERDATMGSLFDGIGGFPYIWEQINGAGSCLWSSEIEPLPVAVTWYWFSRKEREEPCNIKHHYFGVSRMMKL